MKRAIAVGWVFAFVWATASAFALREFRNERQEQHAAVGLIAETGRNRRFVGACCGG